jgi:hypothetical protein
MAMRVLTAAVALILLAGLCTSRAPTQAAKTDTPLILERTIPLADVAGRIDHLAVDVIKGRLFVAELGNGSIDVVDLEAGKVLDRITGLKEPQGVAYLADRDLIVVACRGDGSVRLFRGEDLSPAGVVALGKDADNVRIDAATGHVLVGHGDGGIAIIDPLTSAKLDDIRLAGHPEGFQIDRAGARLFANVPDAHEIAVVDLKARKQSAAWSTSALRSNYPMAFDGAKSVLTVVFRNPPRLALVDLATGALTRTLETCGDADDVFFDGKRDRIYVICGDGRVAIVDHGPRGMTQTGYLAGYLATSQGARTALFVPERDRLFIAAPARGSRSQAAILVFRPQN